MDGGALIVVGVQEVTLDYKKELLIVKGTMDAKAFAESFKNKLPPKREYEGGGGSLGYSNSPPPNANFYAGFYLFIY